MNAAAPEAAVLAAAAPAAAERSRRQAEVVAALGAALPAHALLWQREDTVPYECDGLTAYREQPLVVALPESEAQVAAVLAICHRLEVPVVARGAGTGLSGGALPNALGVTLSLAKFNRIVAIDRVARTATVQCGVRNLAISEAAAPYGLFYAPDPSSQIACTIGGNVAENSGGVHCLKYGMTLHNVLKVRGFTAEGEPVEFGGDALDAPGLDLLALVVGSEGMLAVIVEVTVKLLPKPQTARCILASFADVRQGRRRGRGDHRRRHHSRRPGDDGRADDRGGRGLRPRRLRPRRRGDPAVRERRHRRRGRARGRAHDRGARSGRGDARSRPAAARPSG